MADHVGQRLGNYRLIRLLGKGGFAEVYLAEHIHLNTLTAVKVLLAQLASEDIESFRKEARVIAHLVHPHIVRVLEFGIEDTIPFLVMEYAPNGTMRIRYPKGSRLPLETIVAYVKQSADALEYIHEQKKLVHRDVKPENLLLRTDQDLLLSDFGIVIEAHTTGSLILASQAGTLPYMAPEQIQKTPRPASDQYALGIVVYEWLCGKRPFDGLGGTIIYHHLHTPPPALREQLPTISPIVENIVLKALAKDPKQRFASVQAFATALEQACSAASTRPVTLAPEVISPNQTSLSARKAASIPSQLSPPINVVTLPGQLPLPRVGVTSSNTPIISPPSVVESGLSGENQPFQPSKHHFSRRTIVMGLVGLTGVSIVGSGLAWLTRSQNRQVSSLIPHPTATSPANSSITSTPTPTSTPPSLGTTLYTYSGHSRKIRALAWSNDNSRIASASDDYTVKVWAVLTGKNTITYQGHSLYVEGVAWSPDNKHIVSGSADGTVQIWDATNGNHSYTYSGHINTHYSPTIPDHAWVNRVDWSPDGTRVVSCDQSGIAGHVVTAQVWEVATGHTLVTYRGHTNGIYAVAWSPDNTRIASAGYDGKLQVWDATSGNTITTFNGGNNFLFVPAWSPDGLRIAIGSTDTTVLVLNATNGSTVYVYRGHSDWVRDTSWSRDGTRIASGGFDQTIHIFKADTGENIFTYHDQTGHIDAVGWSPLSKLIASGNDKGDSVGGTVQVWQAS